MSAAGVWFFVDGIPRPQGSKKAVTKGVVRDSSKGLRAWREAISLRALAAGWREPPLDVPVAVGLVFVRARPKSHRGRGNDLTRFAPAWPATAPDIDKLTRAALDALTGRSWTDDSRVVVLRVAKVYGPRPGLGVLAQPIEGMRAGAAELEFFDDDHRPLQAAIEWWPKPSG